VSNTTITPSVGALALAGVAATMGLALAPLGAVATLTGRAPTVAGGAAVGPGAVAWSGLGQNAIGAATRGGWRQARLTATGSLGTGGALVIQASNDNVTWINVAALADLVLPQPAAALYSGGVYDGPSISAPGNGVLVLSNGDVAPIAFLRPAIVGGDGSTAVSITGNLNPNGCV